LIVYLDSSAIVKRYVSETGSADVESLVADATTIGTSVVSRAEVAAAFAKAARVGLLTRETAMDALGAFVAHWPHLLRLQFSEALGARAASLAWEYGLRGYDAVHLATALMWQEALGQSISVATYDRELWRSASTAGLQAWPKRMR
jgi:predicted nucleic acid-binding protein